MSSNFCIRICVNCDLGHPGCINMRHEGHHDGQMMKRIIMADDRVNDEGVQQWRHEHDHSRASSPPTEQSCNTELATTQPLQARQHNRIKRGHSPYLLPKSITNATHTARGHRIATPHSSRKPTENVGKQQPSKARSPFVQTQQAWLQPDRLTRCWVRSFPWPIHASGVIPIPATC